MSTQVLDNDTFISKNFEKIVDKYGSKTIIVCQGEIFTGPLGPQKAEKKYPDKTIMVFSVPSKRMLRGGFLL
jgi:hypothetical protein